MTLLDDDNHDPYDVFRNGLLHEYQVKKPATIYMLGDDTMTPCGLFYRTRDELITARDQYEPETEDDVFWHQLELSGDPPDGRYEFVVERYYRDFVVACAELHIELLGYPHSLIHAWAPDRFDGMSPRPR